MSLERLADIKHDKIYQRLLYEAKLPYNIFML